MKIDLNQPFTTEDVRKLIASKDDGDHRQLRVTLVGIAFLSDEVGIDNISELAFRIETFAAGTDHVGEQAAKDPEWVSRIEQVLRDNWPTPTDTYIDDF